MYCPFLENLTEGAATFPELYLSSLVELVSHPSASLGKSLNP